MAARAKQPHWASARKHELTVEFCTAFADLIRSGKTVKIAAREMGVPPGIMNYWLAYGEQKIERAYANPDLELASAGYEGRLWLAVAEALATRDAALLSAVSDTDRMGESKLGQAAAWKLERFDPDEYRAGQKIEVTGVQPDMAELEGGTSFEQVAAVLSTLGVAFVVPEVAGGEVPSARALLPAPGDDKSAAGSVPQPAA